MRIAVTGASGLVGSALMVFLEARGDEVFRIVRREAAPGAREIVWNPDRGEIEAEALEGLDAVVHLSGENISEGGWTEEKKQRIYKSRVDSTRVLCETLTRLERPPGVWVCASAIGYYGSRDDQELDEDSAPGSGFLAKVCQDWEAATKPAAEHGVRVVNLRIGVVLSAKGGAFPKMAAPFRKGFGGVLGDGQAYMSWISIVDLLEAIHFCILNDAIAGPVNAVAPHPVTNREFTQVLSRALSRPAMLRMPGFVIRLILGEEKSRELLLASVRAHPKRLLDAGFSFQHPDIADAIQWILRHG
ncbi:MAG TPA: TIGR01777 family protein [Candidatus Hydrogenedentes bacterium]|nr:TIGR01777 family protein [Candidatus Hydrogenedentota bacterium]